ncbi:MAG TPA: ABC transporter permease [Anaerolineales bacterium]|nr:ABC transporter permease [Anaerolineales bacterium]
MQLLRQFNMLRRIWAITKKEFIMTLRDRGTLFLILLMPLIQLVLFAYAIHMDVKHISMAVADQSLDQESRSYLEDLVQSGYFDVVLTASDQAQVIEAIDRGEAKLGLVIPSDFADHVNRHDASVLFVVDGSDPFTTQSAYNAANLIAQEHTVQLVLNDLSRSAQDASRFSLVPLNAEIHILYNPDLKDLWFLVPGMIAMLLQTQAIILTALAVVREREVGTIEQILVTPIRPVELMLGKTLPNLIIAIINLLTIVLTGIFGFGVPFQGDFFLFFCLVLLYVFSGLGLGLLISSISQNQRQAQQLAMMTMLLALLISGFVFPHYSMPLILQWISYVFPLTAFIPISRGIFMKGIGLPLLTNQVLFLVVYDVVILFFATRLFRQTLD